MKRGLTSHYTHSELPLGLTGYFNDIKSGLLSVLLCKSLRKDLTSKSEPVIKAEPTWRRKRRREPSSGGLG